MKYTFISSYDKDLSCIFTDKGIILINDTPKYKSHKVYPYGCIESIKSKPGGIQVKVIKGHGDNFIFLTNKDNRKERDEAVAMANDLRKNAPLADMIVKEAPPQISATTTGTRKSNDASVVGRAAVGAVIAGPVGAIVGAISAADKNNRNK